MLVLFLLKIRKSFKKWLNTYHTTIKVKSIDVESNFYAEYNVDSNAKDPKFKMGDQFFVISKIKNAVPWAYVFNGLNGEEIVGTFYEKELQKKRK